MLEPVAGNLSAMVGFEYGYFGRLDYTFNRRNRLPSDAPTNAILSSMESGIMLLGGREKKPRGG